MFGGFDWSPGISNVRGQSPLIFAPPPWVCLVYCFGETEWQAPAGQWRGRRCLCVPSGCRAGEFLCSVNSVLVISVKRAVQWFSSHLWPSFTSAYLSSRSRMSSNGPSKNNRVTSEKANYSRHVTHTFTFFALISGHALSKWIIFERLLAENCVRAPLLMSSTELQVWR